MKDYSYIIDNMIERFMNVYQAVFPFFIWSFQEKSVILQ